MIKKALLAITALFGLAAVPLTLPAQGIDTWKQYALYSGTPDCVAVTAGGTVYYLSMGRLYSYDPKAQERTDFINSIGARKISLIKYHPDRKTLVAACQGGDLVLISDDGPVRVLTDISDASLHYEKNISDVAFDGDDIYATTTFGIVLFDLKSGSVKWSGVYGRPLQAVTVLNDKIIVTDDEGLYVAPKGQRLVSWDAFTQGPRKYQAAEMAVVDPAQNLILYRTKNKKCGTYTLDTETLSATEKDPAKFSAAGYIIRAADGYYVKDASTVWKANPSTGTISYMTTVADPVKSASIGFWSGLDNVWAGYEEGIALFDIKDSKTTAKSEAFRPADAIGVAKPGLIQGNSDGSHIYVSAYGPTWKSFADGNANGYNTRQSVYVIEGDNLRNVSAIPTFTRPAGIAEDPDDTSMYYQMRGASLAVIKDNKVIRSFDNSSMPFRSPYGYGVGMDPEGNLWVYACDFSQKRPISVLPAAKRRNIMNVKLEDWINLPSMNSITGQIDSHIAFATKSGVIVFYTNENNTPILFLDTNGTWASIGDDKFYSAHDFTDQDGRSVFLAETSKVVEDTNGKLWITTSHGVFIVDDPRQMVSGQNRNVRSVKVPRNDGTDFADYLLDGETIFDMSVDANNRKWFATETSGLYCVSPDGTEILHHFTKENSDLPDNLITAVHADPFSSNVYVGTLFGLLRYTQDAAPAAPSYDEVYAYPNPVKPGYTGWITVTNLMNNSLVKIMDSAGQLIYQGRSNGGTFAWDGCNSAGARVKSGIYYVFASQNENETASGAVTKILIMN